MSVKNNRLLLSALDAELKNTRQINAKQLHLNAMCVKNGHRADSLKCKIYKEILDKHRSVKEVGEKVNTNTNVKTDLTNKRK